MCIDIKTISYSLLCLKLNKYLEITLNILLTKQKLIAKSKKYMSISGGSRIFQRGVCQLPKVLLFFNFFVENCMKMKEFGPRGGVPGAPLNPPMSIENNTHNNL